MPLGPRQRFSADLDRLAPDGRLGLAVSGGPDSLALLLLAAEARPGMVAAATVDHRLREDSAAEAAAVADICARLGVPHAILPVTVAPGASLQARAREARYAALAEWAVHEGLAAVATAHHADDQAETLLMRLVRGSGAGGLAGVRAARPLGGGVRLVRPLLAWRKAALIDLVAEAGLTPADDPANRDSRHDRTAVRDLLAREPLLDAPALARSAAALAEAEEGLAFAAGALAATRIAGDGATLDLDPAGLPRELRRRLLLAAMGRMGASAPRGTDLDRALAMLDAGGTCTLGGLKLVGGTRWRLSAEPPRR